MALLPLHCFQQKLGREIRAVSPDHGTQFIVLAGSGKQCFIFQGLKHLAPQLIEQADFPCYAVVEAELQPEAGKHCDRGGVQEHEDFGPNQSAIATWD